MHSLLLPTRTPTPATKVGLVIMDPVLGFALDADATARHAAQMPRIPARGRLPHPKMLDAEGRPYVPATILPHLEPGVPHSSIRAVRWERGAPWAWIHAEYLISERNSGRHLQVLIHAISDPAPTQRGWTCAACDNPTMAVAAHRDRDICLDCWVRTNTVRFLQP